MRSGRWPSNQGGSAAINFLFPWHSSLTPFPVSLTLKWFPDPVSPVSLTPFPVSDQEASSPKFFIENITRKQLNPVPFLHGPLNGTGEEGRGPLPGQGGRLAQRAGAGAVVGGGVHTEVVGDNPD